MKTKRELRITEFHIPEVVNQVQLPRLQLRYRRNPESGNYLSNESLNSNKFQREDSIVRIPKR